MWRTIEYCIWPRDMRFEDGLLALVEFAAKRKLKPVGGEILFDNIFSIKIDRFESVKCDRFEEFVEVMKKTPMFDSFQCNSVFGGKRQERFLRTGVSFDHCHVKVDIASHDIDLVEATHRFIKDTFALRNPQALQSPDDRPKHLQPTVFIGRHFDKVGDEYFDRLSTFLKLLGFDVKQGEE